MTKQTIKEKQEEIFAKRKTIARQPIKTYIKGKFQNLDDRGGTFAFDYDSVHYELNDGEEYTVPKHIADHLTKGCCYPVMKVVRRTPDSAGEKVLDHTHHRVNFIISEVIPAAEYKPIKRVDNSDGMDKGDDKGKG